MVKYFSMWAQKKSLTTHKLKNRPTLRHHLRDLWCRNVGGLGDNCGWIWDKCAQGVTPMDKVGLGDALEWRGLRGEQTMSFAKFDMGTICSLHLS